MMRATIIDQDIPLAEDKRLIKRLYKVSKSENFPDGLEFAYQFLYCQKPPVIEVWHAAIANIIQWFLSTLGIPAMYFGLSNYQSLD